MTRITLIGERTRLACRFRRRRRKKSSPLRKRDKAGYASSRDPVLRKKRIALVLAFHFRSPSKAHPDSHASKLDLATCKAISQRNGLGPPVSTSSGCDFE